MSVNLGKMEISKIVGDAVNEATDATIRAEFEKSISVIRSEIEVLKAENLELKMRITNKERTVEKMKNTIEKKNSYTGRRWGSTLNF